MGINFNFQQQALKRNTYDFTIVQNGDLSTSLRLFNSTGKVKEVISNYDSLRDETKISVALGILSGATVNFIYTGNVFSLTPNRPSHTSLLSGDGYDIKASHPCFLAGTMIATPDGERAVETLRCGDTVTVLRHGVETAEKVWWTGNGSASPRIDREIDEAG